MRVAKKASITIGLLGWAYAAFVRSRITRLDRMERRLAI